MRKKKTGQPVATLSRRRFISQAAAGTAVVTTVAGADHLDVQQAKPRVEGDHAVSEDVLARFGSEFGNLKRPC